MQLSSDSNVAVIYLATSILITLRCLKLFFQSPSGLYKDEDGDATVKSETNAAAISNPIWYGLAIMPSVGLASSFLTDSSVGHTALLQTNPLVYWTRSVLWVSFQLPMSLRYM